MKHVLSILFLFICTVGAAQNFIIISGKVIDKNTNLPLQGASVFAQNTTFGEATKQDGSFKIKLPAGGYDLIVTFTGYENSSTRINSSNAGNELLVSLAPREKALQEVSVTFTTQVKDGWQKYGSFFKDNFIGKTIFGKETEIKNPEALKFFFSKKRNRLKVIAEEPLQITNHAMGYNIKYSLDSFVFEYNTNTTTFVGYPLFEELAGTPEEKKVWADNRIHAYNGSVLHFMRSFYKQNLADQGFEIQFVVNDNGSDRPLKLKDPYNAMNYVKDDSTNIVEFNPNQRTIAVIYKNAAPEQAYLDFDPNAKKDFRVSTLTISEDASIAIEQNGYYFEQSDIVTNGYWGFEKIANMLPYDYVPQE